MSNIPAFTPVPRNSGRHDGWHPDKQAVFIEALAETGIVHAAARKVGMGRASAYRLREAKGGESFAAAWDTALKRGMGNLVDIAMDRAINGVAIPKFYKGEKIGETRWYDNRLLMFLLRQTQTRRFGPHAAEYDAVDEILAAEQARDERNRDALIKAQNLADTFNAMIETDEEHTPEDERMPREEFFKICAQRDRMEDLIAQLTPDDPASAVDAFGRMTPGAMIEEARRKGR